MLDWETRPVEIANLLNPAFGALLFRDVAKEYHKQTSEALPFVLAFLVQPIVLHRPTRDALPKTTATLLHAWIQEHPALQLGVAERLRQLRSYSQEAIIFGLQHGALRISATGGLENGMSRVNKPFPDHTEPATCRKAAEFLGRWFGKLRDPSLILAMWGLRP